MESRTKNMAVALALVVAGGAHAQAVDGGAAERVRLVAEQARRTQAPPPPSSFLDMAQQAVRQHDAGGWVTITSIDLRDDDHDARTADAVKDVLIEDYRVWAKGEIGSKSNYYIRARKFDFDFSTRPGLPEPDVAFQERLELDLGFADWRFHKNWSTRVGRQYVRVGRSLVLSNDLDGATVQHQKGPWSHRAFAGRSVKRDANLDTSISGFNRGTQRRDFFLDESSYSFQSGTRVYAYGMVQQDDSRSFSAAQRARNFSYDTFHLGIGAEGRLDPLLHYFVEGVKQFGEALADVPNVRVDIDATAVLAGLLYYPEWDFHPLISLEFAHGSGDRNRGSVTNTFGGKRDATDDKNFMYFGAYDGGLALSPRLSDISIVRFGAQCKPLPPEGSRLPDLLVGGKISLYRKDEKDGVISDTLANRASDEIGYGVDAFVGFRPLSDLSMFLQYGRFTPGDAYSPAADDATNRVLLTSTLAF